MNKRMSRLLLVGAAVMILAVGATVTAGAQELPGQNGDGADRGICINNTPFSSRDHAVALCMFNHTDQYVRFQFPRLQQEDSIAPGESYCLWTDEYNIADQNKWPEGDYKFSVSSAPQQYDPGHSFWLWKYSDNAWGKGWVFYALRNGEPAAAFRMLRQVTYDYNGEQRVAMQVMEDDKYRVAVYLQKSALREKAEAPVLFISVWNRDAAVTGGETMTDMGTGLLSLSLNGD